MGREAELASEVKALMSLCKHIPTKPGFFPTPRVGLWGRTLVVDCGLEQEAKEERVVQHATGKSHVRQRPSLLPHLRVNQLALVPTALDGRRMEEPS